MNPRMAMLLPLTLACFTFRPLRAQSAIVPDGPAPVATLGSFKQPAPAYKRPTLRMRAKSYEYEVIGPYPLTGAAFVAGVNQLTDSVPEWHQGVQGYAKRFGSNLGIADVSTTARYGLSEAFKDDTLYYRCACVGFVPRLQHAVLSTFTARRGQDGHTVFSVPAIVAPYAGTMTAVYLWYPHRFGAEDAFRMGNYSLLAYVGANISLEFLHANRRSLLTRLHLNNPHGAASQGPHDGTSQGQSH
jgi:hypothetical protein